MTQTALRQLYLACLGWDAASAALPEPFLPFMIAHNHVYRVHQLCEPSSGCTHCWLSCLCPCLGFVTFKPIAAHSLLSCFCYTKTGDYVGPSFAPLCHLNLAPSLLHSMAKLLSKQIRGTLGCFPIGQLEWLKNDMPLKQSLHVFLAARRMC